MSELSTAKITNRGDNAQKPASDDYAQLHGVAPEYLVTLRVTGDDSIGVGGFFEVQTTIDETFSLSMGASWSAPFANVISDGAESAANMAGQRGGAAIQAVRLGMKAGGISERTRATSAQVWESSDPIGFSIPFTFVAKRDPEIEIRQKVKNLLKLTAPSEFGPALRAPGPTMIDALRNSAGFEGRKISLHIGRFLALYNCVVTRVDVQFDSIMGRDGIPLKAKVNVDVQSFYTNFTTKDLDHLFDRTER